MTTPSKRKGSKAELDVVKYLQTGVCFEIKNRAKMDLAGWVEEMLIETVNAKADTGVVVHKRKGKSDVGQWYATLTFEMYTQLLIQAGYK